MPYKEFDLDGIGKIKVYKRRGSRSLRLTVAADGKLRVTMPVWAPYQAGVTFIMSRRSWILAQDRKTPARLSHGQPIGKLHRLQFTQEPLIDSVKTSVRANDIVVTYGRNHAPDDQTVQDAARAACWRALKNQTVALLAPRLNELAALHGFDYRSMNVKRMKTRWGSCDQHRNIVFNLFLVQLPWECIDYVILHELSHTVALNHGPDFWQQLEAVLPNARALRRIMKQYQPTLLMQA